MFSISKLIFLWNQFKQGVVFSILATHLIMEFADAAIQERLLVAKVFSKKGSMDDSDSDDNDPYLLFRQPSAARIAATETLSPRFRTGSFQNVTDARKLLSLKSIIEAQEEGGKRFMGSYFGDAMYGPFPRTWWKYFSKARMVYKVDWDKTGFDLHAALLMNKLLHQEDED
mmetsp:Transcript_12568/g.15596  ORF Transcript_12568/g.15596 Transcript_12568/m.15596 type:complete len:171 (-) Transcript_12568:234-746(-)